MPKMCGGCGATRMRVALVSVYKKDEQNIEMNISTDEFMSLQQGMSSKDVEIERLKAKVASLEDERDLWKMRALQQAPPEAAQEVCACCGGNLIVISTQKLRALFQKLRDAKLLSVLAFVLQKVLPSWASANDYMAIAELVPVPSPPGLTVTAEGDINVEGDWNDVHDNGKVVI